MTERKSSVADALKLAVAHHEASRFDEAEILYNKVLEIRADHPVALHFLGVLAHQKGNSDEAIALISRAIEHEPRYAEAYNNMGVVQKDRGDLDAAADSFHKALDLKKNYSEAGYNHGLVLNELGHGEAAADAFTNVVKRDPHHRDSLIQLGNIHKGEGNLKGAMECYEKARSLDEDNAETHFNLATVYIQQGKLKETVHHLQKCIALKPDYDEAHYNLGVILAKAGKLPEAIKCYRNALHINPDYANCHLNLGMALLMSGHFQAGWEHYARRWEADSYPGEKRVYVEPGWDGGDLKGRTLFVYPEQGLGDFIQFARFIPQIRKDGGRLVVEVPPKLQGLFSGIEGADEVIVTGQSPKRFDVQIPLMDLPRVTGTTVQSIPSTKGYLDVPEEPLSRWGSRLKAYDGVRVGLVWGGSPDNARDKKRSMNPEFLLPLLEIGGVSFFSLQADRKDEAARVFGSNVTNLMPEAAPFVETAAVMKNLDMIITVDTSSAHLAGALGVRVITLLSFMPDWRWMLGTGLSPWYESMRLIRQQKSGDWKGVVEKACQALEYYLERRNDSAD